MSVYMHGLKKDSHRMRCKSPSGFQNPRPGDSTSGVCPVCREWCEELREDGRCREPQCDALLTKLCVEAGKGVRFSQGDQVFFVVKPEEIITQRQRALEQRVDQTCDLHQHTCKCARALKMPGREYCAACYREGNVAQLQDHRRTRKQAAQTKKRKRREKTVGNHIRGLENIKLGG